MAARLATAETQMRLSALAACALVLAGSAWTGAPADDFAAPGRLGWRTWEAELADGADRLLPVSDPAASGGQYVTARAGTGEALEFAFAAPKAMDLRVHPVWWRSGDARPGKLYPYPLSPNPGPDVLGAIGARIYFTAPEVGRVGIVDGASRKLIGRIEVGGYLTDLVADAEAQRVYVTDALNDRIAIIDTAKQTMIGQIPTPREPWSMVEAGGTLYVACRAGETLVAVDPGERRIVRKAAIAAVPINVELVGAEKATLAVRLQQAALDAQDLSALPADELQYAGSASHAAATVNGKRYSRLRAHFLSAQGPGGKKEIDVSAVTQGDRVGSSLSYPLGPDPGPTSLVAVGNRIFFSSPSTGRVGVLDAESDTVVQTISVGGYVSDLVVAGTWGLVYAADALGNRVVAIDGQKLEVVREAGVPAQPWSLAYFQAAELQRPYMVPPTRIEKVYVACREGRSVVALDAASSAVVETLELDASPRAVWPVPIPSSGWWGPQIDDRVPFALHARVAVEPWPVCLDPETLEPVGPPEEEVPARAARRTSVEIPTSAAAEAETIKVAADDRLVLKVGDEWMDVSSVADPYTGAERPLTARDEPGSMTVSVDDGPWHDWTLGRWMNPENEMFLVNGTEEYWKWNAPSFAVKPGRHVLKVKLRSPETRLDALQVCQSPADWLDIDVSPLPRDVHGSVPLPGYQGLFYYDEPIGFEIALTNTSDVPKLVRVDTVVSNYMGEKLTPETDTIRVPAGQTAQKELRIATDDMGRFELRIDARTEDGVLSDTIRFVRLPKLEHPRLLFRREDLPAIRERVSRYPLLFGRYVEWLRRMAPRGGKWPDRFLPPGLTREAMGEAAPDDITDKQQREQRYGWRMYDAAWRMLAVEFAAMYLAPDQRQELMAHLEPLLQATTTSSYCQYHHHGPFFPGAVASLVDMAPDERRQDLPLYGFCKQRRGDLNVLPWTLLTLEEPITPEDRALIWRLGIFEDNLEQYFMTHVGARGGTWWQNPWTGCHCPMHGLELTFVYFRTFFDEPRIFEKPFFQGYLTFHRYLDPIKDNQRLMPSRRGPLGEPWRWMLAALTQHPLEKSLYRWDEWVARLNGPLPDEGEAVDELMALMGMPYVGPPQGGQHHFTTGVAVPVALALGWYEPGTPEVTWDELPPTTLFDVDGWAVMRSGWDEDATEVYLNSGVRDHTTRAAPNHLMIWRGGEALIGWPALWGDDGNNTPMWGNVVTAGDRWLDRWRLNLMHPRDAEHVMIDRFSKPTWSYITRDQRLIGYAPAEAGWGGGLDFHGHTQTIYLREGRVIAYETHPEFDYVAGDASNAWPLDEMAEYSRQIVYVRPDTIVVYDHARLGAETDQSALVLTTGSDLQVAGQSFTVRAGEASLRGAALLPEQATLGAPEPPASFQWKGQKLLRVEPSAATGKTVEYLTIMRTGGQQLPELDARPIEERETVGVAFTGRDGRPVEVRFDRPARPVGGRIVLGAGDEASSHELVQEIDDSYRHWAGTTHYEAWMTEPRFDFVVPQSDRRAGEVGVAE